MKGLFHHKEKRAAFVEPTVPVEPTVTTTTTTTTLEASKEGLREPVLVGKEAQREGFMMAEQREEILLPERMERPAVVHEKIRREEVEEIQPVIHRELDRTEIRQITQPFLEKEVKPVQVHESILPAENRAPILPASSEIPREKFENLTEFEGVERRRIEKTPIIVETVKKHIIEEVQPIIYKEIHEPHIIKLTKPIYEKIVEAPVVFKERLPIRETAYRFEERAPEFLEEKRFREPYKEDLRREELRREDLRREELRRQELREELPMRREMYPQGYRYYDDSRRKDLEFEQDLLRLKEMRLRSGKEMEEVITTTTTNAPPGTTTFTTAAPSTSTAL
jgi:hypothetical protein